MTRSWSGPDPSDPDFGKNVVHGINYPAGMPQPKKKKSSVLRKWLDPEGAKAQDAAATSGKKKKYKGTDRRKKKK